MTIAHQELLPRQADRSRAYRERIQCGLDRRDRKDLRLLADFIECFCEDHHDGRTEYHPPQAVVEEAFGDRRPIVCAACAGLLIHAFAMRLSCPLDPKPACKKCSISCYSAAYKVKIHEVMRYSGWRMILRGRVDYLWHYFF